MSLVTEFIVELPATTFNLTIPLPGSVVVVVSLSYSYLIPKEELTPDDPAVPDDPEVPLVPAVPDGPPDRDWETEQ